MPRRIIPDLLAEFYKAFHCLYQEEVARKR